MNGQRGSENTVLLVTALAGFMSPFMISAVNVALPAIQKAFGMSAVQVGWVGTSYLLAMAMALIPSAKLADIYGRKKAFVSGLALFTLASILAGTAPSTAWLLTWRAVQGLGVSAYVTTATAILTSVFPAQRRGRAMGIYVAAVYIGLSAGPFCGGLLVRYWGWQSIFWALSPLGLVCIVLILLFLKAEWAEAAGEPLDVIGSLVYAVSVLGIVYGVTRLPHLKAYALIAFGVLAMAAFVRRQQRVPYPVFEVSLFQTNHVFAFSSMAALINYAATTGISFLLSLYLQYIKGLDPRMAGLVLVSQPVIQVLLSPLAGRLSDRIQPRLIASAGMGVTVIGLVVLSLVDADFPLPAIIADLVLLGLGFALFSSPNMSAIMGAVSKRHYGIASGALVTMRLLGQMMSMAIATVMLSFFIGPATIHPGNYPQLIKSISAAFVVFTVLCILGVYFSMSRGRLSQTKGSETQ